MTSRNRSTRVSILSALIGATLAVPTAFAGQMDTAGIQADGSYARLVVKYRDAAQLRTAAGDRVAETIARAASRAGIAGGVARGGGALPLSASRLRATASQADVVRLSRALDANQTKALLRQIAADPAVEFVQVDRRLTHTRLPDVRPMLVPNDNYYQQYQWHLHGAAGGIGAESAWETSTGEGVVVAVLDTGITAHPDMDANMLEGYDFITDAFVSRRDSDERVPGAADLGDWNPVANECYDGSEVADSSWHGTHTAGTVAELTNNATGMAGVAHDAKVLPVRVLGRCGGYTSDIADAIVWASGGEVEGVPTNANPAEVINMSLGGGGACDTLTQDAINGAVSRGTTVVVAAGNQGQDASNHSPASCDNVINVGATGITGAKAYYSNYGNLVDLSAPGGGVTDGNPGGYVWQAINSGATVPENPSYGGMAGTSMAAPHVAGIVALIQSAVEVPKTPAEIEAILKESARPFGSSPSQPMGSGIVDAPAALELALGGGGEEPCEPGEPGCEEEPPIDSTPITSGQVVASLSGVAGTESLYRIDVPAGVRNLNVLTYGGTGNVSVYVSRGSEPTADDHDWASTRPGTNETVRVASPEAGVYYVKVVGEALYARVNLQARYN